MATLRVWVQSIYTEKLVTELQRGKHTQLQADGLMFTVREFHEKALLPVDRHLSRKNVKMIGYIVAHHGNYNLYRHVDGCLEIASRFVLPVL